MQNSIPMNPPLRRIDRVLSLIWLAVLIPMLHAVAQPSAELEIQIHASLTITGEVGKVYSIEHISDLTKTNDASAWLCLEFLQLPATLYQWTDKSAPATDQRFYRAVAMEAPTNMVFIPPGTFRMGSPANEVGVSEWERPQTDVIISRGFWMGKYEVTQMEYLAVMGNNPSWFNGLRWEGNPREIDYGTDLSRPVETVSWSNAATYFVRFTEQERAAERIPANCVYRLPTEAEWEYACRAWTSTRFSYGDDPSYTGLTKYAWYWDNSDAQTHPAGQKLPNPWGLYDMHGNVHEWCQSWFGEYPGGTVLDPQGPDTSLFRVVRGGGWPGPDWIQPANRCRSANRINYIFPDTTLSSVGFRAVLAPGQ